MGKSQTPAPVGEVVMIARKPDAPKIREISQKAYNALRPKKELSEKQKQNLAKLIEKNKARAVERRTTVTHAIPEIVPEDQELVIVKPKRKYVRKQPLTSVKNEVIYPSETETETETETESVFTDSEVEAPIKRGRGRPRKHPQKPEKKPEKKPVKSYRYDTETTSQSEESEDSDDEKVTKYGAKIEKRLETVRSIDQRLQQIRRPTIPTNRLSIF